MHFCNFWRVIEIYLQCYIFCTFFVENLNKILLIIINISINIFKLQPHMYIGA